MPRYPNQKNPDSGLRKKQKVYGEKNPLIWENT